MTCSQCQGEMRAIWMQGWRCVRCGHDDGPFPRHHCHLRQNTPQAMTMIHPDEDMESVPLGWETYPGDLPAADLVALEHLHAPL